MSKELEAARELVKMLEAKEKAGRVELSTLQKGNTFKMAGHDFIVLDHDYLEKGYTAVISKDFWGKSVKFGDTRDYNKSNLKRIMDEAAMKIEKEVGAENVLEHEISLVSVDMQNEFGSCSCKVRPLTFDEARGFNNLLVNKELPDWYWTLTPWSTKERGWSNSIAVVSPSGDIISSFYYGSFGVRPFCILKSNIFVSKGE